MKAVLLSIEKDERPKPAPSKSLVKLGGGRSTTRVAADDALLLSIMPPVMQTDYQMLIDQMDASAGDVTPLPTDTPAILYTSTASFEDPFVFEETAIGRRLWLQLHQDLFQNVKDGQHIRVSDAGHNIHTEQPGRIAQDIRAMVDRLESAQD